MNGLLVPGSVGILTALLGRKLHQNGYHDIALFAYAGTALVGYFCVYDYRRRSSKEYKTNLSKSRSAAYEKSKNRPISEFLEQAYTTNGNSLNILKHPVMNQQMLMKFIQEGEERLQRGDKLGAVSKFAMSAAISYIAGGEEKGHQLIATISNMIPDVRESLLKEYNLDLKAYNNFVETKREKNTITREAFISQLHKKVTQSETQQERVIEVLEEDSLDESDDDGQSPTGPVVEEIEDLEPEIPAKTDKVAEPAAIVDDVVVEEVVASDASESVNGFSTPEVLSGSDFNQDDKMETKELSVTADQIVHDEIVCTDKMVEPAPEPVLNEQAPEPESASDVIESIKSPIQEVEIEIVQDEPEPAEVEKTIIPGLVEEDLSAGDVQPEIFNNKAHEMSQEIEDEELE